MLTAISKVCKVMDTLFFALACVLLGIIITASTIQVFTRYVLNSSLTGTEELARYCFVWMSMLGGSICVGKMAHPSVTFIGDGLKGVSKKILKIIIFVLIIVCALIFLLYGIQVVRSTSTQLSPTLQIPMRLVYLCVPIGGGGMIIHAVHLILEELWGTPKGEEVL